MTRLALRSEERRAAARNQVRHYWHTRSFNRLAGRSNAPAAHRMVDHTIRDRVIFVLLSAALAVWGILSLLR